MNIQGTEIKIGRPKSYNGTMSALGMMTCGGTVGITPSALIGLKNPMTSMYHALDDNST
jgi:hypothetical protein